MKVFNEIITLGEEFEEEIKGEIEENEQEEDTKDEKTKNIKKKKNGTSC